MLPPMTNGAPTNAVPRYIGPAISGDSATPRLRAMPVTPAAADRSSGSTTAIVYDWRVGTSIWLMLNRISSRSVASASVGMNGTRISSTFDGRCVNTIVRMSPKRAASGPAASAENAARMLAANRMPPTIAGRRRTWS